MSAASPWPDPRALALLGVELPIVQAPMAGFAFGELAIAVAKAGGLGSLACASLSPERMRTEWGAIRKATTRPINLNFFCHAPPPREPEREAAWQARLAPYFVELGLDASVPRTAPGRAPFDEATCDLVCELAPEIVSFHFGLPDEALVARLRKVGVKLLSSATTVAEARWLEDHGCDAIIAQGFEAGGHRGSFLSTDRAAVQGEARARVPGVATQVGTFALVPQVVDAVRLPVIAAGGIADARGVVAAMSLGACAVQVGTAYLACPEAATTALHRAALAATTADGTALTNVFTGRPARGIVNRLMREVGPMSDLAPAYPRASGPTTALREAAERRGASDFTPLWAGQAAPLARAMSAGDLTRVLADGALALLRKR